MKTKEIAAIAKALGDPTRLQIYEDIAASKEIFCGQLVEKHGLTPGTVSHHLKILTDANLIEMRREGQFIFLTLRAETVRAYARALSKIAARRKSPNFRA
jgi:ArsR family transcriptional regulator